MLSFPSCPEESITLTKRHCLADKEYLLLNASYPTTNKQKTHFVIIHTTGTKKKKKKHVTTTKRFSSSHARFGNKVTLVHWGDILSRSLSCIKDKCKDILENMKKMTLCGLVLHCSWQPCSSGGKWLERTDSKPAGLGNRLCVTACDYVRLGKSKLCVQIGMGGGGPVIK